MASFRATILPKLRAKTNPIPSTSTLRNAPHLSTYRSLHSTSSTLAPPPSSKPRLKPTGPSRDELIPFRRVVLVDPESKKLLAPASLSSLLASLDRTRYSIQLVDPKHDPPICTILDRKAEYAKSKEKKEKGKEKAAIAQSTGLSGGGSIKEVRLPWNTAPNDVSHKLATARKLLDKGNRVKVVCMNGPSTPVTLDARGKSEVVEMVKAALADTGRLTKRPSGGIAKGSQNVILEFERLPVAA